MRQNNDRQLPNYEQLPMQINVKIYRPSVKGPILADASVNLNGCFAVRGVQVKEGKNGPFVSMPSRQVRGEYRDICFPLHPGIQADLRPGRVGRLPDGAEPGAQPAPQ